MTYDELLTNRDLFQTQINAWVDQLSSSTNSTEINNISQIIAIQTDRLAKYDELINNYSTQNPPDPINNPPPVIPGTTKKTNWGFIMLIAGIAAIYFLNRKKKAA
jgi:hypothetical protein